MLAELIAAFVSVVLNTPVPERLGDPTRAIVSRLPQGAVLAAEHARGPTLVHDTLGPAVSAEAFAVLDLDSGALLAAKQPSVPRPVASLTKVLTALTVVRKSTLHEVVEVSPRAVRAGRRGADMGLVVGERIRVRDLLAGLLIPSANDAAVALAEHVSGNEVAFAREMEGTAQGIGLSRTRAENATGFDTDATFSSAYDVAQLVAAAWRDATLGPLLQSERESVRSVGRRRLHQLRTTNRLLGKRSDILGGKTGLTSAAGENVAVVAEAPGGQKVVVVILGSADRFGDAENVTNWTFWAYRWRGSSGAGDQE